MPLPLVLLSSRFFLLPSSSLSSPLSISSPGNKLKAVQISSKHSSSLPGQTNPHFLTTLSQNASTPRASPRKTHRVEKYTQHPILINIRNALKVHEASDIHAQSADPVLDGAEIGDYGPADDDDFLDAGV
ncbi:hypothetical protein F5B21DRAFT_498960 [Xylaria acuta]|nr:hypothetical protein F5B21DRAFT_498960 [Xylaria acuta]